MNIYFFSNHAPDPKMIEDLNAPITIRFKGSISNIHSRDNQISFTEALRMGGTDIEVCHTVPAESIVIVEATKTPLQVQKFWLEAGVATLLILQVKQEIKSWGYHTFDYDKLIQVHKIEVIISPWLRRKSNNINNDPIQDREPNQLAPTTTFSQVLNLFRRLIWQPVTRLGSY